VAALLAEFGAGFRLLADFADDLVWHGSFAHGLARSAVMVEPHLRSIANPTGRVRPANRKPGANSANKAALLPAWASSSARTWPMKVRSRQLFLICDRGQDHEADLNTATAADLQRDQGFIAN